MSRLNIYDLYNCDERRRRVPVIKYESVSGRRKQKKNHPEISASV